MLFPATSQPLPLKLRDPFITSLKALDGLTDWEKLEVSCQHLVFILRGLAQKMDGTPQQREAFTHVCEGVEEWLEKEIDVLHFLQGAGLA